MATNTEATEIGLKTEVRRQVGLKKWEQNVKNHTQTHLVNAWKALLNAGMEHEALEEMIWDYCLNSPAPLWIHANSAIFGITSTIGAYRNKKGRTFEAHFTLHNHYLDSVANLGDQPITYEGNFLLCRTRFTLDITKLPTLTRIEHLFEPKGAI